LALSDAAISTIVTGIVTIVTMLFGYLRLRSGQEETKEKVKVVEEKADNAARKASTAADNSEAVYSKIDENTELTKEGNTTADRARLAAESLTEQFNGSLDKRIIKIVADHIGPLHEAILTNSQTIHDHEKTMSEIKSVLDDLRWLACDTGDPSEPPSPPETAATPPPTSPSKKREEQDG
jgi:hypothetical protein